MTFVRDVAATGKHRVDGPPRLISSRCGNDNTPAPGLNQSLRDVTKQLKDNPGVKMSQELVQRANDKALELSVVEHVVVNGDLSKLNSDQRVAYYKKVCETSGLNPFTRPFDYISLNGKLTLYAKKDCTEQLRKLNGISIESLDDKLVDDIYIVTAKARDKTGRTDQANGAVTLGNLKGEARANAIMKAETKAKRRVTLSISGLGWTDESETETIPNAKMIDVDMETGEIKGNLQVKSQVKHEEIPVIENQAKLSPSQVEELYTILDECDEPYRKWVFNLIKETFDSDLSGVPAVRYEKMKAAALNRMEKNYAKQRAEAQPEPIAAEVL